MITKAQYDALGPVGREIIDTDRQLGALRASPTPDFRQFGALRQDRKMLTNAAAIICARPRGGASGAGRA